MDDTLNGSLEDLAELMETNLNIKYVDDAQASDKLTTLARKILRTRSRRIIIWTSAGNSVEPDLEYISGNPGVFDIYVLVLGENEEPVINHSVDLTIRFLRDLDNGEITEIMTDMGSVIDSNVDDRTFDLVSCTTNSYGFATFTWKAFAHGNFVLDGSSTVEGRFLHETYEVRDYWKFDDATKDQTHTYSWIRQGTGVLSYDSINKLNVLDTHAQDRDQTIPILELFEHSFEDFEYNLDVIKTRGSNGCNIYIQHITTNATNNSGVCGTLSNNYVGGGVINGYSDIIKPSGRMELNIWYNSYIRFKNNILYVKLTNKDTGEIILEKSCDATNYIKDNQQYWLYFADYSSSNGIQIKWKNLKIRAL